MPVNIEDRPVKNIREEVIDQLVMNYGHEEITLEAFEKRLDTAMDTEDRNVLLELVADLDLTTDNQYQKTKSERLSKDKHYFDNDSNGHEKILKVLSSSKQNGPWVVGGEIGVTSILSDFTLDFTDAIFNYPVVHVKMFSLLTSDTIFVPAGVRVVCKTSSYLSSIKSRVLGGADENAQTIVIHGNFILSSLDIKIRVTLKEKWLNFADGVRNLLN
ncbi:MAG: DUF1707 and DUF2154 domain-containing protein [Acidiferrobacterales bacterium]